MQLWTYHPTEFRLDDSQSLGIDPKRGQYWNDPALCYKASLRLLLKMLGTEHFPLWCFTVPDSWMLTDVTKGPVEWELNVPEREILAFIREPVWHAILCGRGDDWDNVVVKERPLKPETNITAVVQFPLSPEWRVTCRGRFVPKAWRDEASGLKEVPKKTQRHHIQIYRDYAADLTNIRDLRDQAGSRGEYLEGVLG